MIAIMTERDINHNNDIYEFDTFIFDSKINFMGNILYIIAVILIIGWLLGFFVFNAGGLIHTLLVIALIVIIIRVIQGRKVV